MIKLRILGGEDNLGYDDGPYVFSQRPSLAYRREGNVMTDARVIWRRGHELRDANGLQKQKRHRNILP